VADFGIRDRRLLIHWDYWFLIGDPSATEGTIESLDQS
jgi:hypothetical protein